MTNSDINFLAQLIITGFDLWHAAQARKLSLNEATKEQLIDRLKKANELLMSLPDLEVER